MRWPSAPRNRVEFLSSNSPGCSQSGAASQNEALDGFSDDPMDRGPQHARFWRDGVVVTRRPDDPIELVEAARQGDRAAFGQLYDRYARMVHGILLARVPLNQVDDLVQDVFLLALPRLQSLRDSNRFGAWLAAIARNRANDYHRQSVDEVELPEDLPDGEGRERMTGGAPDAEAVSILGTIRSLPETYRETLLLRLVEGMTGPEIAQRTGLTPGSVRVNLHRGMQQLREKLSAPAKAVEE